jgi:hypothetical protein
MINDAVVFVKNRLDTYLNDSAQSAGSAESVVTFIDGQSMDPISFKIGAVTAMLVNVESENQFRSAEPYARRNENGQRLDIRPDIRLNLYLLFAARYKQYEDSLRCLSRIIHYFQYNHVFDHSSAPELSDGIEKLIVEMMTLTFSEQNELWGALRLPYHPSLLYKVKTIVYRSDPIQGAPEIKESSFDIKKS